MRTKLVIFPQSHLLYLGDWQRKAESFQIENARIQEYEYAKMEKLKNARIGKCKNGNILECLNGKMWESRI